MSDLGMVMLLIMMAAVLGYAMTIERAPQEIAAFMTPLTQDPLGLLLIVCGILVVTGMLLEGAVNILLVTPIVMPVLVHAGFDPVHMGIIIVLLINFGGLTPPVGVIMFTVCGILNVKTASERARIGPLLRRHRGLLRAARRVPVAVAGAAECDNVVTE